jgi:hypothetical protein
MNVSTRVAVVVVCAVLGASHAEHASAQIVDAGFKGLVQIRVVSHPTSDGPPPRNQTVWYDFLPGESKSFMVTAGHNGDLCRTGAAGPMPFTSPEFQAWAAQEEASAQYVWHFDVHMIEVKAGSLTFDLSWQRTSRTPSDERLRYSQRLTLAVDETRPIDLLHSAPGKDCGSVVIFAEAGIRSDPSLLTKTLEWSLWASTGPKTSNHQTVKSVQGHAAEFMFEPLTVPGSENGEQMLFFGTVIGRARLDGDVEVAIDVNRITMQPLANPAELIARFKERIGGGVGVFRKNLTAKPGEAVKIVVPTGLLRKTTDPVTGKVRLESVPPVYEMSVTVQARVR